MTFRSIIGSAVLLSVLTFGLTGGCKKTINHTNPSLLATVRVSIATNGTEGNLDAVNDSIGVSNDGRFIAFTSKASNLVPGDTNNVSDVFLRDNLKQTLTLVSVSLTNGPANGASGTPAISGNGNYVVFTSLASNLSGDTVPAGVKQVYVRDMVNGVTTLVSRSSGIGVTSQIANADCNNPRISADGVYVAFESMANNLDGSAVGGDDTDANSDIFRRKWNDGLGAYPTEIVSFGSGFSSGAANKGNNNSFRPDISADGRYIAFESDASNLVFVGTDGGPDLNGTTDVFVRDMDTATTVRCSVELPGTTFPNALNGPSRSATISQDGKMVAFRSTSGLLSTQAQETLPNIFLRAWAASTPFTEVLSVHTSGATGGQNCDRPSISGDGSKIAWQSPSPSLVNGDTNGVLDVFLRNRLTAQTSRESVQTFGGQLDGQSEIPYYSADGRYIVFWSQATNGVDDDTNGAADIYMRGPPFK